MKNEEILQKAIKKAKTYTYQFYGFDNGMVMLFPEEDGAMIKLSPFDLIFSHSFAKAFWGIELKCLNCGKSLGVWEYQLDCGCGNREIESWQYHLQQMVLSEDPIKYLERFI